MSSRLFDFSTKIPRPGAKFNDLTINPPSIIHKLTSNFIVRVEDRGIRDGAAKTPFNMVPETRIEFSTNIFCKFAFQSNSL